MSDPAGPTPEGPASLPAADLLPLVYDELRALARHRMAQESVGHTLQATALVHEVYLRLAGSGDGRFANKGHFWSAAAEAMRRILIEHARAKGRVKRGGAGSGSDASRGGGKRVPLNVVDLAELPDPDEILAFDEAIRRLEGEMPTAAAVVRLRFYSGLSIDETAKALDLSPRTVNREWTYARAWLFRTLHDKGQ